MDNYEREPSLECQFESQESWGCDVLAKLFPGVGERWLPTDPVFSELVTLMFYEWVKVRLLSEPYWPTVVMQAMA